MGSCQLCTHKSLTADVKNTLTATAGHLEPRRNGRGKTRSAAVNAKRFTSQCVESARATISNRAKTLEEQQILNAALCQHFVFSAITTEMRDLLVNNMVLYELYDTAQVFAQGQPGVNFYVVNCGAVDVFVGDRVVKTLKAGDSFGELALIDDSPRTATVQAHQYVALWALDRNKFQECMEQLNEMHYEEHKLFIESVPIFSSLTKQ